MGVLGLAMIGRLGVAIKWLGDQTSGRLLQSNGCVCVAMKQLGEYGDHIAGQEWRRNSWTEHRRLCHRTTSVTFSAVWRYSTLT